MSWRHYVYGLQHLGRSHLRRLLENANASRIGAATEEAFKTTVRDLSRCLEVPR